MAARLASPSCLPRTASLAQHPTSRMCAGPKESLTRSLLSPCPAERVQQSVCSLGCLGCLHLLVPRCQGRLTALKGSLGHLICKLQA